MSCMEEDKEITEYGCWSILAFMVVFSVATTVIYLFGGYIANLWAR